jgi:hypothetical protein
VYVIVRLEDICFHTDLTAIITIVSSFGQEFQVEEVALYSAKSVVVSSD